MMNVIVIVQFFWGRESFRALSAMITQQMACLMSSNPTSILTAIEQKSLIDGLLKFILGLKRFTTAPPLIGRNIYCIFSVSLLSRQVAKTKRTLIRNCKGLITSEISR
jgi:hypothetical protein